MASAKEKAWLAEYLKTFNATEAARRAGYKWPRRIGSRKKQKFADEISAALKERVMSAEEALAHLSDQARADISPYVDENGINLKKLKEAGLGHLIKSARRVRTANDDRLEVEVYDKQAALVHIGRHHGLFSDVTVHKGDEEKPIRHKFDLSDIPFEVLAGLATGDGPPAPEGSTEEEE